jgi:hypothetical protein
MSRQRFHAAVGFLLVSALGLLSSAIAQAVEGFGRTGGLAVQRKLGSSGGGVRIDNFCQVKDLDSWQEQEHGCRSDSEGGACVAAVLG